MGQRASVEYKCRRCGETFRPLSPSSLELAKAGVDNAIQQHGLPIDLDRYKVPMFLTHECSRILFGVADLLGYRIEE